MQLVLNKTNKHFIETKLTQKGIIAVEDPVEHPGEEPGGPALPLLFLDQTETPPPLPYLNLNPNPKPDPRKGPWGPAPYFWTKPRPKDRIFFS